MIDYDMLFYFVDDFCKGFEPWYKRRLLAGLVRKKQRTIRLSLSEVLTILLAYHQSGYKCFKYFYQNLIQHKDKLFPGIVDYSHFTRLAGKSFPALLCLLKSVAGEVTEYMFIDATPIPVCHTRREKRHRVFRNMATKGKTSMGWFFGFKLHMIFNTRGEIVRLHITPGNTDDRKPVLGMLSGIKTKLIGDKGYISKKLFAELFKEGTTLITRIKKNMKNILMDNSDLMMLMRRSFIETIFSSMKALHTLIHSRHRSPLNAFSNLLAGLIKYQLKTDKPSLKSLLKIYS